MRTSNGKRTGLIIGFLVVVALGTAAILFANRGRTAASATVPTENLGGIVDTAPAGSSVIEDRVTGTVNAIPSENTPSGAGSTAGNADPRSDSSSAQ